MTKIQYFDEIKRGHFLYWDMLGNLHGVVNHKEEKLRWLTGDINFSYFADGVEMDDTIKRMSSGEIPKSLFFLNDDSEPNEAAIF